ncbi:hypothetical protein FPD38_06155 [Campylobacter volucris]|uniref:Lipoprotein n=1 Tax=Campylobacter volucris TaxID=1031542 RepID=A0A5C7DQA1_9BACT|nr:hypothetical protein FPD38_06155 [Campylobacter volucris]
MFGKFIDNITTCFNFSVFHFYILSFFLLIFLCACGYKDIPFYETKDVNNSTIEIKKFQTMESEI